jgi:WD40 repeat protein
VLRHIVSPRRFKRFIIGIINNFLVYYQIFSADGVVESKCSYNENNPYTGRVIASHITPPRTVESIKRFLCKREKISNFQHTDLLVSILTSMTELSSQGYPQILALDGPGSVADDPMALVIKNLPPTASGETRELTIPNSAQYPSKKPFSLAPTLFQSHKSRVNSISFSVDGTRGAFGASDHIICIWDVSMGELAAGPFKMHTIVESVAFSSDGRHIISGFLFSPHLQILDARTGIPTSLSFQGHTATVASVAFSADGQQLASGS